MVQAPHELGREFRVILRERASVCFMGTVLDVLAVGNLYLQKRDQNFALKVEYGDAFELD